MQGDETIRQDLLDLVLLLNTLLAASGIQVIVNDDADPDADIQVHYAPLGEFDAIASANGFPYVPGNWGYFYTFWNGTNEIQRGYVLLATDQLAGDQLRHFTFEEVTQVLGLSNDSPRFANSIFFSSGADGGQATDLSPLDRQLVSFFYEYVEPGFGEMQLSTAFDAHFP